MALGTWFLTALKMRVNKKERQPNMSFSIGEQYDIDTAKTSKFLLAQDKSLLYSADLASDYSVLLGGNWRFELCVDSQTGLCVKILGFLDKLRVNVRNIEIPISVTKKLYFHSDEQINSGEGCHYFPFSCEVFWDTKRQILAVGDMNGEGEHIEFAPHIVATISKNQILCIYMDLSYIQDDFSPCFEMKI